MRITVAGEGGRPFLLALGDDEPGGDVARAHPLSTQVQRHAEQGVAGDGGAADGLAAGAGGLVAFQGAVADVLALHPGQGGKDGDRRRPHQGISRFERHIRGWTDVLSDDVLSAVMDVQQHSVSPRDDFYRTYSAAQVDTIVDSLVQRGEFPYELTYLGDGSEMWREAETPSDSEHAPMLSDFDTLLTSHAARLLAVAPSASPVRIVDLGPGTTRPVRGLIRHLLDESRLAGYRAIDLSAQILELARQNLRNDFPGHAERFELCRGDFTGPDLARVLAAESDGADPVRFVVLAGGTLYNFADPARVLRHVCHFLRDDDALLLTLRIDTGVDRPPFMDQISIGGPYKPQQLAGLDLLAVDRSWYVTETGFDRDRSDVFVRVRFVEPVTVTFAVGDGQRAVPFEPGDTVLVWRYLYHDAAAVADQLGHCGLRVRLFEHGQDKQVVLVAATPAR